MKVFLRVPTNGHVDRELTRWLMWLERFDTSMGQHVDADIHYSNFGPAEARNEITEAFLDTDCTHLWMVDRDVVPPRNLSLLAHDKPIVCGLYKGYKGGAKAFWQVYMPHPTKAGAWTALEVSRLPPGNPVRVPAAGAGCMLIRRDMLEGVKEPFFYSRAPNGKLVGEDMNFCRDREAWLDKEYVCSHYRDVNLNDLEG